MNEVDFYELCLEEGHPFYADVYPLDRDMFNQWVRENLAEIITIDSYEQVVPDDDNLNHLYESGYVHIYYQCHYSAKAATILKNNFFYFTGFVRRNSFPYSIITHSFNQLNGEVVDLARINDPVDPIDTSENTFPHTYYGIQIPRNFVLNYQQETLEERSMNPLLVAWYLENN